MKAVYTVLLLLGSNVFMTLAWYGHLRFKDFDWAKNIGLIGVIFLSWLVALFEYFLQVPANRMGSAEYGGPYSLIQLKVLQEVISILVFVVFSIAFFKNEELKWNHGVAFLCLICAVYFAFKKF